MTRVVVSDSSVVVSFGGTPVDYAFEIVSVSPDFDERNSVYIDGEIVLAPMPSAVFAQLDVTTLELRVELTLQQELLVPAEVLAPEMFDLVVYARSREDDGLVTLKVASDEMITELRATLDGAEYSFEVNVSGSAVAVSSARAVVGRVLDDALGASLTADAADVDGDVSRRLLLVNLSENPSFESSSGRLWASVTNATAITRSTSRPLVGAASMRFEKAGAGATTIRPAAGWRVEKDVLIFHSVELSAVSGNGSELGDLFFRFVDGDGNVVGYRNVNGWTDYIASGTGNFTYITGWVYPWEVPPGAVSYNIRVRVQGGTATSYYLDCHAAYHLPIAASKIVGPTTVDPDQPSDWVQDEDAVYPIAGWNPNPQWTAWITSYITLGWIDGAASYDVGAASALDLSLYDQSWDGGANLSTSRIVPIDPVPFDLLTHYPGIPYRQFLDPIIGLTGGRLFCDETRTWRLVDSSYQPTGDPIILEHAEVVLDVEDELDLTAELDGVPTVYTGVVLEYEGVDPVTGLQRTWRDIAGNNSGRVWRRKITDNAYTGPGEAAAALARSQGRVTQMRLSALADWRTRPGLPALHKLPSGAFVESIVSRVAFQHPAETMDLTLRDVVTVFSRNYVKNPSPQDATVQATGFAVDGPLTGARVAGAGVAGGYGYRGTFTSASSTATDGVQAGRDNFLDIPVTSGETITPSLYVGTNVAKAGLAILYAFYDAVNALVGSAVTDSNTVPTVANDPLVRLVANPVVVPAGATHMIIRAVNPSAASDPWAVGDTITTDRASTAPGPYYDGSTPDDDRFYSWETTPYQSPSRASHPGYMPDLVTV